MSDDPLISPKAVDADLLNSQPYGEGPDVTIAEWFAGAHKVMERPATLAELVPWLTRPQHAKAMTNEAVCAQLDGHRIIVTNGHAMLAVEAPTLPVMDNARLADEKKRDGYRLTAPGLLAEPRKNTCRVSREAMLHAARRRADGHLRIGAENAPALSAAYVMLFVIHAMEIADQVECEAAWDSLPSGPGQPPPSSAVRFSNAGWTAVIMPVRTNVVDVVVPPLAEGGVAA